MPKFFGDREVEEIIDIIRNNRSRIFPGRSTFQAHPVHNAPSHYQGIVTEKITAADGATPGSGKINIQRRDTGTGELVDLFFDQVAWQTGTTEIPADPDKHVVIHADPWGDWWIEAGAAARKDTLTPRIHFRTDAQIANRAVAVTVTHIEGQPLDIATGAPIAIGDTVTVYDPHNKSSEIEAGATGIAFLNPAIEDDPETTGEDETREAWWEIESCELPINYVECYLTACVEKTSLTGHVVEFKTNATLSYLADGAEDVWRLSNYPNVQIPPEWTKVEETPGGNYKFTLSVENPFKLDAVSQNGSGSGAPHYKAKIRRVVQQGPSDPTNDDAKSKANPYSGTVKWQIVSVEQQIARHVIGTITGTDASAAIPTTWIDGGNPMTCDETPVFDWFCTKPCDNGETACFWATYDPERHKYWIVATDFALMGKPVLVEYDPNLRIETAYNGDKSLCVDKVSFLACKLDDTGDSCVPLVKCP